MLGKVDITHRFLVRPYGMGILRDWVVDAVAMDLTEGGTALTMEALKACTLDVGQRVRLEMEARAGERKIEDGHTYSQQQLQSLLGKGARGQQGAASTSSNGDTSLPSPPTPQPVPGRRSSTSRHRIERAPARDPVGTEQMEALSNKCSFRGEIALSPRAMQQAGVSRVECPQCATMRSLSTQGEPVRFPPHDKRKTSTPNRDARWTQRRTTWELVGK